MSVYRHQQGSYRSYRVARSVNGELRQAYFPRTRDGLKRAKAQDAKWSSEQSRAQRKFTGPARRWTPKPKALRAKTKVKVKSKAKPLRAKTKVKAKAKTKTRNARPARAGAPAGSKAKPKAKAKPKHRPTHCENASY